jgi:hypothetical protein
MKTIAVAMVTATVLILGVAAGAGAICGDTEVQCWAKNPVSGEHNIKVGLITVDACYHAGEMSCAPCAGMCSLKPRCDTTYPEECQGSCWTYWYGPNSHAWRSCGPSGWRP